jgi:chromosome segregation protein
LFTVNKLKISGFKSFAHPIELLIEDGVTGIIGPNGCGKSNIFEAIRWVMGESSSKSLRSGSMDDVIFNGTQNLPAKNFAEVSIELDEFTDNLQTLKISEKKLIITRILERGVGSFFKINNRDVRSKDVSVLFYDSGSGPRSSSIIGQGNIDQIINYKPIERKIILEDAAGISGLQARRRESELKLQSTDLNLEKVEINLSNLFEQKRSLSRQARQAERYENLSQNIKLYQSLIIFSEWKNIKSELDESLEKSTNYRNDLKAIIQKSDTHKERFSFLRKELEKIQSLGNEIRKKLFETKSLQNEQLNKLDLIKNKKEEISKFLNTIINDKNNEHKILENLENYIQTSEIKISDKNNLKELHIKLNKISSEEEALRDEIKQIESIYVNEMQLSLGDEFKSDNLKEEKENLKKEETTNLKEVKILNESIKKNEKFLISEQSSLNKLLNEKKNCERKIISKPQCKYTKKKNIKTMIC